MAKLPQKLKADSIAEALLEVRFQCDESERLPEIVLSKLTQFATWKDYEVTRTPLADFPFPARMQDPNLRYQPILELRDKDKKCIIKVGTHVVSIHRLAPYPGWDVFKKELEEALDYMFGQLPGFVATRLGFRYINLFETQAHGINGLTDLAISTQIAGEAIAGSFNLNVKVTEGKEHTVTLKIASRDFVLPEQKESIAAVVDVDVQSNADQQMKDVKQVKEWVEKAHTFEKQQFFRLFTPEMLKRLVEVG